MKRELNHIGRPSVLRHTNALSILSFLRQSGSCSRADLVRSSGLSAPTVTNVVKDLEKAGLVEPLGEGASSGGRPPDMIRFKAERGCILAVEISTQELCFLLTDLNGDEMDRQTFLLKNQPTRPRDICSYISQIAGKLLRKHKKTREQLLTLVVGVPAITNVQDGIVFSISTLDGWRFIPLGSMLKKLFRCLVVIENDTNLAAFGECYRGAAKSVRDFILISLGTNLGAGIILNGEIHHGSQWSAGEIGYLRLPATSRRPPTIHEFGELETVLGSAAVEASWSKLEQPTRSGKKMRRQGKVDALAIFDLAQNGDPQAAKIIQYRAALVADIIVNLSLILNPGLILLGGAIGSHPELLSSVRKQLVGSEFAVTRVDSGMLGASAVLWGAVAIALDHIPALLLPSPG